MALRLSTTQVTWVLVGLWLAAVATTVAMVTTSQHPMEATHYAPAVILTVVLVAWPFALGWRPFTPAAQRLRTCHACGTEWRPADEGTNRCPACGA